MDKMMLRQYFRKLGFGKKTGINLPNESTGKIDFKYETEIFNAGFGQGITTTPIQIAQAMTSLQSTAAASERVFEFLDEIEMSNQKNIIEDLEK